MLTSFIYSAPNRALIWLLEPRTRCHNNEVRPPSDLDYLTPNAIGARFSAPFLSYDLVVSLLILAIDQSGPAGNRMRLPR